MSSIGHSAHAFRRSQMANVPHNGVRTFLPPQPCRGGFTPPLHSASASDHPARPPLSLYRVPASFLALSLAVASLTIQPMRVLEAKEFLAQQTAEQAALENVSLSDRDRALASPDWRLRLLPNAALAKKTISNSESWRARVEIPLLRPQKEKAVAHYFNPTSFSNSPSLKIVTPNSFALSYFDPGSVPTTT